MTINKRTEGDWTILELAGFIDAANAAVLHEAIASIGKDVVNVRLDFANVSYICSVGLREILSLRKRYHDNHMELVNVMPEVREIFTISGFSSYIPIRKN